MIDLRSDTVTRPSPAMRRAMAQADVGDDAYGDDPSVRALEAEVAVLFETEAALFCPTATLANQLALGLGCRAGETVACFPGAHVQIHEQGGAALHFGVQLIPIGSSTGFSVEEIGALLEAEACGWPRVAMVWLENTLTHAGGCLWPVASIRAISELARASERFVHLDGARLWNACEAEGLPPSAYSRHVDTLTVCLSKGLGAPAGALLLGSREHVARARRLRSAFGGTLRQAGILAAAGLYAVRQQRATLADDHRRAKVLAAAIADPFWSIDAPQTNIVLAKVGAGARVARSICETLGSSGVLCHQNAPDEVRFVLHRDIDDDALERAILLIRSVVNRLGATAGEGSSGRERPRTAVNSPEPDHAGAALCCSPNWKLR